MSLRHRLLALSTVLLVAGGLTRGSDEVLDSIMYRDPMIALPKTEPVFDPELVKLWLTALERPEVEMRTSAALATAAAHREGMKDLKTAIEPLQRQLDRPDQHPNVRYTAAQALIALEAKSAAGSLHRHVNSDPALGAMIDPALARWDYGPARAVWLERLDQPPPVSRSILSAVQSLATVRETKAVPPLRKLLFTPDTTAPARLEIARALAHLSPEGLESDAMRCSTDSLAGVSLLRHHNSEQAVRLLQTYATHKEDSVARVALERLLELDPKLAVPALDSVLSNSDADTRKLGVEVMTRLPSVEYVTKTAGLMADQHPLVRNHARRTLARFASDATLLPAVRECLGKGLSGSDWRSQEQAAILAGQLHHKSSADRLVELLTAHRPEVFTAAAWALRELTVPETFSPVLDHLKTRHQQLLTSGPTGGLKDVTAQELDRQLSQLTQLLGKSKFKPADETFRALVPRFVGGPTPAYNPRGGSAPRFTPVGGETRAAAIWALGQLHAGESDPKLADTLLQRLTGDPGMGPDDERVRRMVPVALARMKAVSTVSALRDHSEGDKPTLNVVSHACRWALAEFDQKPLSAPSVVRIPSKDWFLVPHK